MVLPIGGNQDSTYQISNSLMFAEPDHAHLEKTYSGSSTSNRICTMSFWYKPGKNPISEASTIFSAIKAGGNEDTIEFTSNTNYNRVLSITANAPDAFQIVTTASGTAPAVKGVNLDTFGKVDADCTADITVNGLPAMATDSAGNIVLNP